MVFITKKVFVLFLCGSCSDIAKYFTESLVPIPEPSAKFHLNPSGFGGDISGNVSQTHYNIGVKPIASLQREMKKTDYKVYTTKYTESIQCAAKYIFTRSQIAAVKSVREPNSRL